MAKFCKISYFISYENYEIIAVTFVCLLLIILQGCISDLLLVNMNKSRLNRIQSEMKYCVC